MTLTEAAKEVIELSRAVQNHWDSELPKLHPDYPFVHPGEATSLAPPREVDALQNFLGGLADDLLYQLALVAYLGRGDFGTTHLLDDYLTVQKRVGQRQSTISNLTRKAALADYLTDGLAELEKAGIDADHLNLTSVNSAA